MVMFKLKIVNIILIYWQYFNRYFLERFYVGQNIAIKMSSSNNANFLWNWVMDAWYNEYKIYIYPKAPDEKTGHYTQVCYR